MSAPLSSTTRDNKYMQGDNNDVPSLVNTLSNPMITPNSKLAESGVRIAPID